MNEADDYLKMMNEATAMRGSELKSKFTTMLFTYRNALSMLSALNDEFNAITNNLNDLDINILINHYKPTLDKANDLVNKIEYLEDDIKNHSDMKAYLSSIKIQLKSHNIDTWVKKIDEVKHKIIKAKEAEEIKRQAELERQRKESKEAEEIRKQEFQRQRNEEAKRKEELERQEIVTINGLMWEKETHMMNWHDAMEYAKNLRFGGYSDWRLPTQDELKDLSRSYKSEIGFMMRFLGGYSDWLESKGFMASLHWSSNSISVDTGHAWAMSLGSGYVVDYRSKGDGYYVRCVRGG